MASTPDWLELRSPDVDDRRYLRDGGGLPDAALSLYSGSQKDQAGADDTGKLAFVAHQWFVAVVDFDVDDPADRPAGQLEFHRLSSMLRAGLAYCGQRRSAARRRWSQLRR